MNYKNILAAVDLTEESDQVLNRARDEADRHGARLSLVHVVRPMEQVYGGFGALGLPGDFSGQMATLQSQALKQAQSKLVEMGERVKVKGDQTRVLIGNASGEIQRLAEEMSVDLIVVGSHGRHGLGLLLGSTANGVLHGAKVDVLAIRVRVAG